jgi:hypothetical protein
MHGETVKFKRKICSYGIFDVLKWFHVTFIYEQLVHTLFVI